jgi:hypothetical protein
MVNDNDLLDTITKELSFLDGQKSPTPAPYNLNFFRILGLPHKELYHSKFIKFLLDPKGTHGYENAFLNLFIKVLEEKNKTILQGSQYKRALPEKKVEKGRVDIIIENIDNEHHIIIENKIYAIDQFEQLKRYKDAHPKATLVYLTLNGRNASQRSLGKKGEKGTLSHYDYIPLSYIDIIGWIEKCIKYIIDNNPNNTKMVFLLIEYLVMVRRITMYEREKDKILPILATDKDTLNYAFEIWDEVNKPEFKKTSAENEDYNIKKKISYFIIPLKAYLIREKFCNENDKDTFLNKLCAKFGIDLRWKINEDKHIMHKGLGFKFHKDKWKDNHVDKEIVFEFRKDNLQNCFYGLCKYDPINFKKGSWLEEPESLTNGYSNWYRKVFLQLMNINTEGEEGLFYILEDKIGVMIKEIEKDL